jgi:hypothetical protein
MKTDRHTKVRLHVLIKQTDICYQSPNVHSEINYRISRTCRKWKTVNLAEEISVNEAVWI